LICRKEGKAMKKSIVSNLSLILGLTVILALLTAHAPQSFAADSEPLIVPNVEGEDTFEYSYYYKGRLVTLNLSQQFIAIKEKMPLGTNFIRDFNMLRSPLSDQKDLKHHGYSIYHLRSLETETQNHTSFKAQLSAIHAAIDGEVQPVFEQGPALLIPSDEIVVGFREDTTLEQAWVFFSPYMDSHGILAISAHRKNTFILKINNPSDGRIYPLSQIFSRLDEIRFAEPNHIIIMRPRSELSIENEEDFSRKRILLEKGPFLEQNNTEQTLNQLAAIPVDWMTLVDESFESASLPAGWSTGIFSGAKNATWSVTDYRSHSGSRSCYATGGGTRGIAPPGPYPNNAIGWLDTPIVDLAAYEEVYIELWFYAKYQNPSYNSSSGVTTLRDYGLVGIYNPSIGITTFFDFLAIPGTTGNLTADVTTDNGWRRALFRVPLNLRLNNVMIEFVFYSNKEKAREGLYIDQVRVVGTTDVDKTPLGNDTYGARQYELKNAGQIAGLGNDDNDMEVPEAWDIAVSRGFDPVSTDVLVAVIDTGIDLIHPDLNLEAGYDYDGSAGGSARNPHGTAVAGNIGAIYNNSRGVIGTAPNVKILSIFFGYTNANMAAAIDLAVEKGAQVLNNSWGWAGAPSSNIESAIYDALAAGRAVVFAAGNGPDRPPWTYETIFPCNLTGASNVICVGATSPTDEHKAAASSDGLFFWGSSYIGDGPDVCAPGSWSYTTDMTGSQGYNDGSLISDPNYTHDFSGTSSSTPKVAGIVALMLSIDPTLNPSELKRILGATADDIDAPGEDDKTGAGRVNAFEAVSYVLNKPRATTGPAAAAGPTSMIFTLDGTVNPNGASTTYYFEYGPSPDYGFMYHYRLVATHSPEMAYGMDKTFGFDTDADSMPDAWEQLHFGDLTRDGTADEDDDGLIDLHEFGNNTDPNNEDSDSDGLNDGDEVNTHGTNPNLQDTDGDGLSDGDEVNTYGTNPNNEDTDGDGLTDKEEVDQGRNPLNYEPDTPVLVLPTDTETDVTLTPHLQTHSFSDTDGDNHAQTRWQISSVQDDFTEDSLVLDIISDSLLTTLNIPKLMLSINTTYYWRTKHIDDREAASEWSIPFEFTTTDTDEDDPNQNGIPEDQEVSDSDIDFDNNGTPDINQADMKCVNTGTGDVQCVKAGTNVTYIDSFMWTGADTIDDMQYRPDRMPKGLTGFKLEVDQPGDPAEITIYSSSPMPNRWFNYNLFNGWQDFTANASFSPDSTSVTLAITDGGDKDCDGVANGIIIDPSGPAEILSMWLVNPNGGETIPSGSSYTIAWDGPAQAEKFKLQYSLNNGKDWKTIQKGIVGKSYDWQVPKLKKNINRCLVKVTGYNASGGKVGVDKSDAPFNIEVVTITAPNGGETLTSGNTYNIKWDTYETKKPVLKILLKYTLNGGKKWLTIGTIKGNNPGTYLWTVPTVLEAKDKCKVMVQLKDKKGKSIGADASDGYFGIEP
jgi:hypothetical protein